jgi:hypothetical protein
MAHVTVDAMLGVEVLGTPPPGCFVKRGCK